MTRVALYSVQPVLAAGLQAALAPLNSLMLSGVFPTIDKLIEHVEMERPDLLLIELTEDVTLDALGALKLATADVPMILWVNVISTEFAAQAVRLGVRGILRKSLTVELQGKCLMTVAAGQVWVEKALKDKLLNARRVALTTREGQVVGLLVKGMKNKEIGHSMGIKEGTVKVYLSRLYQKVGVKDRFELAVFAMQSLYENRGRCSMSIAATSEEQSLTTVAASYLGSPVRACSTTPIRLLPVQAGGPYSVARDPVERAS